MNNKQEQNRYGNEVSRPVSDSRRLKEIKHTLWLKEELIKQTKKEIQQLLDEKRNIEGEKRLVRKKQWDNRKKR